MGGWRAGLIGAGIVLIGLGGYSSLEGVWKGLSLVAAGIALVLLGLSVEPGSRPAATTPEAPLEVEEPGAAAAVDDAEATPAIERTEPAGELEPLGTRTPSEPAIEIAAAHEHEQPLLGYSELVSHLRDSHPGAPFDGSTIQLRLLHERTHAD